ncbi:MAG: hypothetical protein ACK5TE_11235 [Pseudomonadota bacterium]|jgi:outer membrane lipoprotein SlyB
MMTHAIGRLLALLSVLLVAGCASVGSAPSISGEGTVLGIAERTQASQAGSVVGAIGGAVLGSVIGGQFGGGFGQTVAATAGAVGGSMVGSQVGSRAGQTLVWDLTIRFEDGIDRMLTVTERPSVRPGDRVSVRDGQVTRR